MNIVFTGTAYDRKGTQILRADLASHAEDLGYTVQRSVQKSTQMLVASRVDTVKARKAEQAGIEVIDYPTFLEGYLYVDTIPASGSKPERYVDLSGEPAPGIYGEQL